MTKAIRKMLFAGVLSAVICGVALPLPAQDKPAEKKTEEKKKGGPLPFNGNVASVDKTAMTLTVKGKEKDRVFTVTSQSKISKDGKPATFDDVKAGEHVTGSYKKGEGDKMDIVSLYVGERPEKKKKDEKKEEKK